MSLAENYQRLQELIAEQAVRCGRSPSEIQLIAVTKGVAWEKAGELYTLGCRHFGESRVGEALEKQAIAAPEVRWHLVGTMQRNKVRKIVGHFALIHSVDSLELAQKLSQVSLEVGCSTAVTLQTNTSGELSKHGLSPEQWIDSLPLLLTLRGIELKGVMTMAPLTTDRGQIGRCFSRARQLRNTLAALAQQPHLFTELSMGMSSDYLIAIAEGATLLRIGSALFTQ